MPDANDGFRITSRDGLTEIVGTPIGLAQLRDVIQEAIERDKSVLTGDLPGDAVLSVRIAREWPA